MEEKIDTDVKLMQQAETRVKAKRGFRSHLLSYVGVNIGLVVIYIVTSIGADTYVYFWPIWCMIGWGIGLLVHGLHVYVKFPGKSLEEEVQIEYERLKGKQNENT